MAVKENLIKRLRQYVTNIPDDMSAILNELLEYENLNNADDIRKLDRTHKEFVNNKQYPSADDLANALRLV